MRVDEGLRGLGKRNRKKRYVKANRRGGGARGVDGRVPAKGERAEVVVPADVGPAVLTGAKAKLQGVFTGRVVEQLGERVIFLSPPADAGIRTRAVIGVRLRRADIQLITPPKPEELPAAQ